MKSIQNQYRDLKEGKMTQTNFMRNLRMTMPQYITNVTSFSDAVKILKNKAILTETNLPELGPAAQQMAGNPEEEAEFRSSLVKKKVADDEEDEILAMLDKIEQEKKGEEDIMSQYDPMEEELNEGKKKKYHKPELHPNQIHPSELRMGIKVELEHTDDLDKAKQIALDHLAENPYYYTALKLAGIESPSAPKIKPPVEKKAKKKDTVELVDKENQMKPVSKKKLKESVDEMYFADEPADAEKYQIKKDMKGNIVQATNDEGNVFSKNDEAIAIDNGEKIKIASFKEEQGKVKALYNKGMFFATIDIDGLKPINKGFRPGVNLGGSFEKLKSQLKEIVRETVDEYYDGRDNLVDPIAAEEK